MNFPFCGIIDLFLFSLFLFSGDLLSVSELVARRVRGLFNFNERAVYYGTWQHGFFAMAAVGATNVGSIKVYHDKVLTLISTFNAFI